MSFGQITQAAPGQGAAADKQGPARRLSGEARLALGLGGLWAVFAALLLAPGALILSRHEGDAVHMTAIVLRMAEGQVPHLDFMTPIGVLAAAPVAAFVAAGWGFGTAFLLAQVTVAALILPAAWYAAQSRFGTGWLGLAFGALVLVMAMALTHGGTVEAVSISMHYNRWAWAVAFVALALALLPPARPAPRLEGAILGLGLAVLALTKVTYFVALAPVVLLALALRREGRTLAVAVAAGLAVVAAATLAFGAGFWAAYLGDLLAVATSETRAAPGRSYAGLLTAPEGLGVTLAALAAVVVLRRQGRAREGLVLLAALPGLYLVTWQNYGNDPQWLPLVGLVLLARARPGGATGSRPEVLVAVAALALSFPWLATMATSPQRALTEEARTAQPLAPALPQHDDIRLVETRLETVLARVPMTGFETEPTAPGWGAALPECGLQSGGVAVYRALAAELEAAGFAGRSLLLADTVQALWLFGDFVPLPGGAPWYYGGLPGGAAAELVVVPLCPIYAENRDQVLAAVEAAGWTLREVHRGPLAAVLEIGRP